MSAGWLADVKSEIRSAEYRFTEVTDEPGVWSAPNRSQELRSRISTHGIEVFPRSAPASGVDAEWTLALGTRSFGREGDDYGWMVGRVEGSDVTCRFSHRHWQIHRKGELLRESTVEEHQVQRATARQQRVVALYEVCERLCEANARMFAEKGKA